MLTSCVCMCSFPCADAVSVARFDAAAKDSNDHAAAAAAATAAAGGEPVATPDDKIAWVFHAILCLASLYIGMLVSNWGMLEAYVLYRCMRT